MFGFTPRKHEETLAAEEIERANLDNVNEDEAEYHLALMESRRWEALGNMLMSQNRMRQRSDTARHRRQLQAFNTGDLVMVHRTFLETQKGRKMEERWEGPYRLKERIGQDEDGVSWKIEGIYGDEVNGKYHIRRLKRFHLDAGTEELALQAIKSTLQEEEDEIQDNEGEVWMMDWKDTIDWEDIEEEKSWTRYDKKEDRSWW
jgi:hypothetical protein